MNSTSVAPPVDTVRTVLLTGATGFLGRFQAMAWLELMAKTGGKLILIARGSNPAQARRRIEEALESDPELLALKFGSCAASDPAAAVLFR